MTTNVSQRLKVLLDSARTVFTTSDLQSIWQENDRTVIMIARRMVEKGVLLKLAKGYYAISKNYDPYELASLVISPSYVSLDSALFYWNVCFQQENTISSVALLNYERTIDERIYIYYAMKESLFFNLEGIIVRSNISLASPERAILDSYYFGFLPSIDNQDAVNFDALGTLALLYPHSVQKQIQSIYDGKIRPQSS